MIQTHRDHMISFEEAQRVVEDSCAPLGHEVVPLESAVGRVLAATLYAGSDLVPFARSAMDGYALRAADTTAGGTLSVNPQIYAERSEIRIHVPGTATEIATGAPVPLGADAVVPVELVTRQNGTIQTPTVTTGSHIFPPGEDARAGDVLVESGVFVDAAIAGLLAAAGNASVQVFRRPHIAVITTGDEVVAPSEVPAHGQIRDSNGLVVAATFEGWGCTVTMRRHARDDRAELERLLIEAQGASDLVVTTGGASVGERDFVKPLLRSIGYSFAFESVALRPAKPTAFGSFGHRFVCVLPGNPSSAFVALHELARIAAFKLAGRRSVRLPRILATLGGSVHGKAARAYVAYADLSSSESGFVATPLANQCSALTRTAAEANGFIVVQPGKRDYVPGDRVDFDVVDWVGIA